MPTHGNRYRFERLSHFRSALLHEVEGLVHGAVCLYRDAPLRFSDPVEVTARA
jgi:hypothetical protein